MKTTQKRTRSAKSAALPEQVIDYLTTEYTALRAELLKRIELQHQLMSLALVAFGTFLTVGIQGSSTVSMAYPPMAMFLAISWSQSDIRIRQIHQYVKKFTEERILNGEVGWEHVHRTSSISKLGSLSFVSSRGILIGTQVLAVVVALLKTDFQLADQVLLGIDLLVILFTLYIIRAHKVDVE